MGAVGALQRQLGARDRVILAQFGAPQAQAAFFFTALDALPFLGRVQFVELAAVGQLHVLVVGRQPQAADAGAVGVVFIVAQLERLDRRHRQAIAGQEHLEAALQALVELLAQFAIGGQLADRMGADEFERQLAHRMRQQLAQFVAADRARGGHEVACKGRHVLDPDADRKAQRDVEVFAGSDVVERERHRQGAGAGDQDLGVLVAQQVVQAREEAFDLVLALRHLGRLVALQDEAARGGRHPQGLDEQAGQFAHAEEHGQFVGARHPAVLDQHRLAARRAQDHAAAGAVARIRRVPALAASAAGAFCSEHLQHIRLRSIVYFLLLPTANLPSNPWILAGPCLRHGSRARFSNAAAIRSTSGT